MEKNGVIPSLQVVRAIAAVLVVYHHAFRSATIHRPIGLSLAADAWQPSIWWINLGSLGVDLFFVLSGFLMMRISGRYFSRPNATGRFLLDRVIRIWPLYMVFTALVLGNEAWKAGFHVGGLFDFRVERLLSVAFIPRSTRTAHCRRSSGSAGPSTTKRCSTSFLPASS